MKEAAALRKLSQLARSAALGAVRLQTGSPHKAVLKHGAGGAEPVPCLANTALYAHSFSPATPPTPSQAHLPAKLASANANTSSKYL